jgi:hypothetical protein
VNPQNNPDDTAGQGSRRPGQWPVDRAELPELPDPGVEPDRRHVAEQARFHITLNTFRGALEEQPTPNLVRAAGRRWLTAAAQIVEEVANSVPNKNKERDR